jgi:hypothetical protein
MIIERYGRDCRPYSLRGGGPMYVIEYADGAIELVSDLQSIPLSYSDRVALERLAPGSAFAVASGCDEPMTFTRLPDTILSRGKDSQGLGRAVESLLGVCNSGRDPTFAVRPNLRYFSIVD